MQKHPNWTLVSIYADEGLSGTSTQKRKEFNRMIEDCKAGKIDLILTKSISRFARNYVDCGKIVRELIDLNPPVGVRFGSGIFLTPLLLGYDRDEEGNLVINEGEAKIVRLIFFSYSAFVPDVHFEKIPIKNLVSNQTYQRNLSIAHIQKTAGHFNVHQINPVKVSRRDGINYVFNGQYTIEIVASVSGSRDTPVWCMVYDGMDYTEEADTFAKQQKHVKPHHQGNCSAGHCLWRQPARRSVSRKGWKIFSA